MLMPPEVMIIVHQGKSSFWCGTAEKPGNPAFRADPIFRSWGVNGYPQSFNPASLLPCTLCYPSNNATPAEIHGNAAISIVARRIVGGAGRRRI